MHHTEIDIALGEIIVEAELRMILKGGHLLEHRRIWLGSRFKQGYAESAIVNGLLDLIHDATH